MAQLSPTVANPGCFARDWLLGPAGTLALLCWGLQLASIFEEREFSEASMNAVVNLGNPRKDMAAVADSVLGEYSRDSLKITGMEIYSKETVLLTSAAYGAGMTLDSLQEMTMRELIGPGDAILLVGSMGSLSKDIVLNDVVLPNPSCCAYYGFEGAWLEQDRHLLNRLREIFAELGIQVSEYRHGSSFAVFDPHTDHVTYKSSLYQDDVKGVDCGEVFVGIQFGADHGLRVGAVLYCSDSPEVHIANIGEAEFAKLASQADRLLNEVAVRILVSI